MQKAFAGLTIVATLVGAACDAGGDDSDCTDSEKCDLPSGNGDIIATQNSNAELMTGYHTLFDKTTSICVEPEAEATGAPVIVGGVEGQLELVFVESREDLARELEVDLGLKVKYAAIGSADVGLNLVDKFSSNTRSVNVLLKLRRDYTVTNRRQLKMRPDGLSKLTSGPDEFTRVCGTHYVNGIRYGASLYLLMTYHSVSTDTAQTIKATLGLSSGNPALDVTGDLQTRLTQLAKRSDVSVTVRAAGSGFNTDVNVGDVIARGITTDMFGKVDELRSDMDTSIELDACRDAGLESCGGAPGPGFANNTLRKARATGLQIGFYDALPNVSLGPDDSPFAEVRERIDVIENFVRGWSELEERILDIYWSEIEPFQSASSSNKAGFQLAPPSAPLATPAELNAIVNTWSAKLLPPIGSQIGAITEIAVDRVSDCWGQASLDIFTNCAPDDADPRTTEEWKAVAAELDVYGRTGRVLPMRVVVGTDDRGPNSAEDYCRSFNTPHTAYRLPTLDELKYIDPLISFGNVNWNGDVPHEIWFTHPAPANQCGSFLFPHPSYIHAPGQQPAFDCSSFIHTAAVICVASAGPAPLERDP